MNKSYKVVWNASSGTWTAASEIAKSRAGGKSSKKSLMKLKRIHGVSAGEMIYRPILDAAESVRMTARENTVGMRKAPVVLALSIGAGMVGSAVAETHIGAADGGSAYCVSDDSAELGKCGSSSDAMVHSEDGVRKPSVYSSGASGGDQADAGAVNNMALSSDSVSTPEIGLLAASASDAGATKFEQMNVGSVLGIPAADMLDINGNMSALNYGNNGISIGSNAAIFHAASASEPNDEGAIAIGANSRTEAGAGRLAIGYGALVTSADTDGGVAIGSHAKVDNARSSVALGKNSVANRANTVSVGNTGSERQIVNVAAGTQGTDAGNITQLNGVAMALGGGAGIGADGSVTAPTYTLDSGKTSATNVGDALSNLDGRVTTNATNVEKLQGNFADTGLLDAKTGKVTAAVTSDQMNAAIAKASSDRLDTEPVTIGKDAYATSNNVAVGEGAKADTGGAGAGVIAIGANAAAGRPGYSGAIAIGDGARAVDGSQGGWMRAVAVGAGAQAQGVSVAIGPGAQSSPGNGVALGDQASVGTNATWAVALGTGSAAERADTVSVGNAKSQRQIVNVAAGTQDTDVVNVTQLKSVATALGGGASIGADGSVTSPAYTLDSGKAIVQNVGDALSNLDGRVTTNASDIESLKGELSDSNKYMKARGTTAAQATGARSIAIGDNAVAKYSYGPGEGGDTNISIGANSFTSTEWHQVALGDGAYVWAAKSSAIGFNASATSIDSVALGSGSVADRRNTVSIGSEKNQRQIVNVAAGTQGTDAVNVTQLSGVTTALGGGAGIGADGSVTAPQYHVGDKTYGNVGDAITAAAETGGGADPNAVAYDDAAKSTVTLAGEQGTTLKNVAAGAVNATSMEAVNGSQLYGASQSVASALGGGSTVDAAGKLTAPAYTLDGGKTTAHNVGDAVSNLDGRVTTNATNVEKLQDNLADSGLWDKDKNHVIAAVTYDRKADGTADRGSVTLGGAGAAAPVALKNVAVGTVDTDAANVSQLKGVTTALGGGAGIGANGSVTAPKYHVGDKTYGNVGDAITAAAETGGGGGADPNAVAYDDAAKSTVTLAGEQGTTLKNVAAGAVNATSLEAMNGSQLYGTSQSVASALGGGSTADAAGKLTAPAYTLDGGKTTAQNVGDAVSNLDGRATTNATNVEKLQGDIAESGLMDKDTGKAIAALTYDRKEDGTANRGSVTLGGAGAAAPVALKNVAVGTTDTDAVNVSQLKGVTTVLGGGAGIGADGSVTAPKYHVGDKTYGNVGDAITAAAETGGSGGTNPNAVSYDDKTKGAITLAGEKGTTLKNVTAGVDATDAVNVGQLSDATQSIRDSLSDGSLSMRYIKVKATGQAANAMGANTVAIGSGANATGNGSLALGTGSRANGLNSVAIGLNSVATEANQVSVGDVGRERRISNVADGTEDTDAVNVNQLTEAIEKMSDRTDKLSSELRSRHGSLTASVLAAKTDLASADPSKFLQVAGAGADGSQENTANIVGGDPASDTAAAIGVGSIASGANAVALGVRSYAYSDGAVAIGNMAQTGAGQANAVAIGSNVTTNGESALAVGSQARANGDNAIALGNNNVAAIGANSIAIGNKASSAAGATNGIALGASASVARNVADSMALGANASVEKGANSAVALGTGSKATRANTVSVGNAGSERQIVNVAAGTQGTDAVNVTQLSGVTTALGGGAGIGADGSVTAPKYHVGDKTYGNVGDAITAAAETGGGGGTNPNAVSYDDKTKGAITLAGEQGTTLKNVAAGAVNATSMEAMNGAQLYGTSQSVASVLGGGSTVDAAGKLTAPAYTLDGGKTTTHNVGDAFSNLDGRVTTNATNVEKLQGDIAESGLIDKDTGKAIAALTYDRKADGTTDRGSLTLGGAGAVAPVALKNVAGGISDTDAVNVGQMKGITTALGGDAGIGADGSVKAPTYHIGDKTYANVGDALAAAAASGGGGTDSNAVVYDDAAKSAVTLSGEKGTTLKKVAAGAVSADSTEAVNGSQLYGAAQSVASALGGGSKVDETGKVTAPTYKLDGDKTSANNVGEAVSNLDGRVTTNATNVEKLQGDFAESGLVDKNTRKVLAAVTYDRNDGTAHGNSVTLGGADAAAPVALKNVADGAVAKTSTDALNGSQLYGASQSVASALGGDSIVDAGGTVRAPTYTLDGGKTTAHNVGDAFSNLDGRVTTTATNVEKLQDNLAESGLFDKDKNQAIAALTYDRKEDGTVDRGSVTLGGAGAAAPVALKNVAMGIGDTDAANVGQVKGITTALGGDAGIGADGSVTAPKYRIGDKTYGNVGDALAAAAASGGGGTDSNAVLYDDAAKTAVTLSGEKGTTLKNVAAGAVNATSMEAMNGSQLYGTSQSVASALGGGSTVDATGKVTAPTIRVGKKTYDNVSDAIAAAAASGGGGGGGKGASFVTIDGMGSDGSRFNTASISGGDPESTTAAAIGVDAHAAGANAIAVGLNSAANSNESVAIGNKALTGSDQAYSVAIGSWVTTNGAGALAIGSNAKANGDNAVALGNSGIKAIGESSIAIGNAAEAAVGATNGIAMGTGASVAPNLTNAMALGANTSVEGSANGAVALGAGAKATRANTVSVGNAGSERQIVNVAAGTQGTDAVNVTQLSGVTTALGGGAGIGADGSVTAPKYHVGDKTYGNVGDAITAAVEIGSSKDPNAVAYDDAAKSTVTLAGEKGTTLKNVAAGAVNATSMEAVNGSQLYGTSQSVASALGGGSTVDAAGKLTAPSYTLDGGKTTAQNVGDAVSNLDGRVTTNATNVEKLQDDIAESGLIDKDTGKVIAAVTYDRKEDGTADRGSVTLGGAGAVAPVALKNVAAGAVNATSTEAVNGSQLYGTSQSVASALGGGSTVDAAGKVTAPSYHVGDKTYGNVGDAIVAAAEMGSGTDPNAVAYDDEAKSAVTLAGEQGTALKNVAAGAVNATSMEAVNGSQLYGASQSVASVLGGGSTVDAAGKLTAPAYTLDGGKTTAHNVGDAVSNLDGRVTTNATNVEKLQDDIAESGLVDKDTGKVIAAVTYDRKEDGTADRGSVTLGGAGAAAPVALKNVAAGVDDTDAVNLGQLNTGLSDVKRELAEGGIDLKYIKVRASGAPATATGAQSVAIGSKALAGGSNTLALGTGARALASGSVALGANSVANEAMTVSVGDDGTERKIVHVKAGDVTARSTDAINGSQLFEALGKLKSRVAAEQSHLLSRVNALADSDEPNSLVVVDGMGGTNSASISGGDPDTTTAAAIGVEAHAAGANAIALGLNTGALSDESVAIGNMAQTGADQPYSVAIGSKVTTNGAGALAIGSNAKANGENAVAVGNNGIKAIGESSIAIGNAAEAAVGATNGIAMGTGASVAPNLTNAMALGANTSVEGSANGAVALGAGAKATRANTVSVGNAGSERQIVNVAAGTQGTDAVNVTQLSGVTTALGGGAGIGADGSVTAPKYHVGDKTYGNVGDAIAAAAASGGGGGTDPNAVAYDDAAKSTVTLAGEQGTTLKNVAAGAVNATSMEAVNGSQLHGASQSMATALGGGSQAGTDGTISAPSYSLAGGTTTVNSVGAAIGNLDGRVTANTGDISTLKDTIASSGLIDPETGHAVAAVRYDRNEDGSANRASVTLGDAGTAVGLHNVAAGAVSATSTDAVNGSQLHGTATSVANAIGGDTTVDENGQVAVNSIEVGGHKYATVSQAVQAAAAYGATDSLAVRYDVDSHGNPNYGSVTLGGPAAAPVMLTNVADGKSQYDAVNYGQLSSLKSDFENRLGTMDDRVSKIETTGGSGGDSRRTVGNDLISGSGEAGQAVTAAQSGNGSNNVAMGSGSTINDDAGNATAVGANATVRAAGGTAIGAGADAHAANSTVIGQDSSARGENSTAIGQGAKARGDNSVAIGAGSVANEDNTVSFGDGSDQGKRRIVNIADGVNASDAATKGQLDRAVGGLQGQINGVSRNAYSGIAAATALTMIPGVDPGKTLSFGIGSASYKGYQAVAFGGEARINKNLKMKAGVGLSSGGNTVGLGASYQW
ncbi:YadA-like family protein [Burkholderia orbicola]|uniref:YadA-like family protein n=2 Tax=Burkholderia TaxID=32008 RepID=UPI002FE16EBC